MSQLAIGREGWWRHGAALLVLVAVICLRFPEYTVERCWLEDEAIYFQAFERVANGLHPYNDGDYLYLPFLAVAGAFFSENLGADNTIHLIRALNLLGAATMAWCGALCWPISFGRRLLVAAILLQSPGFEFGLRYGNLSLSVGATVVLGLFLLERRPIWAGLLLGLGAAIKPMSPGALAAIAAHRPAEKGSRLRYLAAAAVGGLALVACVLPWPYFRDFLELRGGRPLVGQNIALHRLLWTSGIELDAVFWSLFTVVLVALVLQRYPLDRFRLIAVAAAAAILALPLVWSHTLLITLPLQMMAVYLAWQQWQAAPEASLPRRWALYRFLLVALLATSMHFCATVSIVPTVLVAAVPALAPFFLTAYLIRYGEPDAVSNV